jgi:hypothetical protein
VGYDAELILGRKAAAFRLNKMLGSDKKNGDGAAKADKE